MGLSIGTRLEAYTVPGVTWSWVVFRCLARPIPGAGGGCDVIRTPRSFLQARSAPDGELLVPGAGGFRSRAQSGGEATHRKRTGSPRSSTDQTEGPGI